jgi:hypothetical protein
LGPGGAGEIAVISSARIRIKGTPDIKVMLIKATPGADEIAD